MTKNDLKKLIAADLFQILEPIRAYDGALVRDWNHIKIISTLEPDGLLKIRITPTQMIRIVYKGTIYDWTMKDGIL